MNMAERETQMALPSVHQATTGARWLILVRLIVLCMVLSVLLLSAAGQESFPTIPTSLFALLVGVAFLNLAYLILLPYVRNHERFVTAQILLDVVAETAMVFLTRGVDSNFVYLYFASIMGGSMLLPRRDSALLASCATVGLAVVTTLHLTEVGNAWIDEAYRVGGQDVWKVVARMLSIVTAFFLVAYLSALLRSRLVLAQILNEEILQNMPEGVVVFDRDERLTFLNAEFRRLFARGEGRPEVGEDLDTVFPGEEMQTLRDALRKGKSWRFELEDRPAEGVARPPLEIRIAPIGEEEQQRGLVALFIDLSWRRQVDGAMRRAARFEAVSQMAAGLAHEIRNPLAAVRGSVQELKEEFEPDTTNAQLCDIVMKASDRLDLIIGEFLNFARARPLHLTQCNLIALLEEWRALLERHPLGQKVKVVLAVEEAEMTVRADAEQLRGIFLNLGLNACAAMRGEGQLRVDVTWEQRRLAGGGKAAVRDGVRLAFTDTGPGLAPGAEDRVFEPFYTTRQEGTGLGLPVVRRSVEAHQGQIQVESRPGEGATFAIWLPVHGPHSPLEGRKEGTGIIARRMGEP